MEIDSLIEYIKTNKPKVAMDIRESLLLLNDVVASGVLQVQDEVSELFRAKDYAGVKELADRSE